MNGRKKVTVVGAGNVGATCAFSIARRDYADVVLVDIIPNFPQGKALDMNQAGSILGFEPNIVGANGYDETEGSDVVVITAGKPRSPGMSRDDLVTTNEAIVGSVTREIVKRSPKTVIVVVSNPLDAMCQVAHKVSGFPKERVFGMAGILDSARMRAFIAMELGVSVENTHAFVLGGHGDTMVPLPRYSTVAGVPITELLPQDRIDAIVDRTRKGGAEIVGLLKTGSAYYAPSAAAVQMVDAVLKDKHKVLPCACYLEGEFGIEGLYVGVPAQLGSKGVEKVWEIKLTDDESAAIKKSAAAVQELVDILKI
jgi:malate dehydrogenase